MNQRYEEESSSPKRRRLDELFADEPFLSPTMKARRLHEKLNEQAENDASPATQGLPSEAYVRSVSERPVENHQAPAVSLVDAAIFLRSKGKQAPRTVSIASQERLTQFRDSALKSWLESVERK